MSYLSSSSEINTTPTHVYFDALITNRNSTDTKPVQLTYFQQRTSPILAIPEDYYFSIIRFSLDSSYLPVFIPTMDLTSEYNLTISPTNPQPTIYSITLTYTDATTKKKYTSNQCNVNWIPEFQNANLPINTTTTQDTKTNYYYCYSYQWFILLVNNAFNTAFNSLKQLVQDDNVETFPNVNPPFMVWNISSGVAVLNADVGLSGTVDAPGGGFITLESEYGNYKISSDPNGPTTDNYSQISIYFNSALYQLFNSFPSIFCGYGQVTTFSYTIPNEGTTYLDIPGGNVLIPVFTYGGQTVQTQPIDPLNLTSTANFAQISQEYTTVPMWNPIEAIVFTSTTIPVFPEQLGSPLIFNNGNTDSSGENNNIISSITDFQSSNGQYRSFIAYSPASEYRLIDLFGNKGLSAIDIACYFRTKYGDLVPFYLVSGASCSIKFMFRKRNYFLN